MAGEVANKQMENVSDAVPTYKQMAQLDYNAEQNRLANAGNIYSQLDSTEYSRNRDLTQDYKISLILYITDMLQTDRATYSLTSLTTIYTKLS